MNYLFYIFLGLLPSIIWLCFFLRKDAHPESNRMILKIFLFGMLATLPIIAFALWLELLGFFEIIAGFLVLPILILIFHIFFWATAEEILKYLVVRGKVLSDPEFDEPVDAMLYMIIAGLGFAAAENILILFRVHPFLELPEILLLITLRFLGATFLHALCSGIFGYFLVLSFLETKKRTRFFLAGLLTATFLHGLYNFSIIEIEGNLGFIIPVIILISLAISISLGFKKVKKLKSICKLAS